MSPSVKKRPLKRMVFKMQGEEPKDKIHRPIKSIIERKQLKLVLKNLLLLRRLKSRSSRIKGLQKLARKCWNFLFGAPRFCQFCSGRKKVHDRVKEMNEELWGARYPKMKLQSSGKPEENEPESSKPKMWLRNQAKPAAAASQREEQVEPEVPRPLRGHGMTTCPGARGRQPPTREPKIVFLMTHPYRTPKGDMKQLEETGQQVWFEGLPTRIHIPAPRVICRPSTLRLVKRCCTRFCSASLELPMTHRYKV